MEVIQERELIPMIYMGGKHAEDLRLYKNEHTHPLIYMGGKEAEDLEVIQE